MRYRSCAHNLLQIHKVTGSASHGRRCVHMKADRRRPHQVAAFERGGCTDDWPAYVSIRISEEASPAAVSRERSVILHLRNTVRRRKQPTAVPILPRQRT